jgi:small multidrug resistance pump
MKMSAIPLILAHVLFYVRNRTTRTHTAIPDALKEVQVPTSAILFAMLSGVSVATWTICLKLGSTKINAALGALVISVVALMVNAAAVLTLKAQGHEIVLTQEAFWLLVLAGIAASGVDIFALLAYERGLRVTSSLIMSGMSTMLVLLVGFLVLQEPLTGMRVLAIALIAAGIVLLQAQGG